jgi:hypothetical protein
MSTEPRYFVLQARDPDHGSPVFEARFSVAELEDLRALIGPWADDDQELEASYTLDAAEVAAITARFGVAFDPEGRETHLWPWDEQWESRRRFPYPVHNGFELPLLLEGRKQLADMSDAYPPDRHFNEDKFDRYVAEGILHKEVIVEPYRQSDRIEPYRIKNGPVFEGTRRVYYSRKGEDWRILAYKLIWDASSKSGWNEDFERLQVMLFGYEEWQIDWWLADLRRRRMRFGCAPVYCAVSQDDLAWIDTAGYRALPPIQDSALSVSLLYDLPDDAARRMMDTAGGAGLVRFSVRSRPFLDLADGQSGPDYTIPAGRTKDLNRNIEGHIEVVARRHAEGAPEPAGSHLQETRPPQ